VGSAIVRRGGNEAVGSVQVIAPSSTQPAEERTLSQHAPPYSPRTKPPLNKEIEGSQTEEYTVADPALVPAVGHRVLINCPGRKPPKSAVKRPARPYKSPIEDRFAMENAKER
jgi:hypothetical protein